ncbi:MAG TPA: hypothetical protein VNL77_00865 [Roseiflexaceae bacterium]|nr:hypothetical protein [Roseiflexaceae bacterium]
MSDAQPTIPAMRLMLYAAAALVFVSGVQLFVLADRTADFFAWTIRPPLTAAFLGAAYWAACAAELIAARQRRWADARIAVPAVLVFTAATLVVTLLHLDRFHLGREEPLARGAAWAWLVVYAAVPLLLGALLLVQLRAPGAEPQRSAPLPLWVRANLALHAALMLPLGLALLAAPQATIGLWPWQLTPLTGRAIGAWSLGLGFAALHALMEGDWRRLRPATPLYVLFGLLGLLALARYPAEVDWPRPSAWVLVALLLNMLVGGLLGWRAVRDVRGDGH